MIIEKRDKTLISDIAYSLVKGCLTSMIVIGIFWLFYLPIKKELPYEVIVSSIIMSAFFFGMDWEKYWSIYKKS